MISRGVISHRVLEWTVLVAGVLGVALWLAPAADRMLTWDEVHYVQAARDGWWPNAVDRGSMGPVEFVRYSLAKARGQDANVLADATDYREDQDMLVLRHWLPPAGLAPAFLAVRITDDPELAARWSQVAWTAVIGVLLLLLLGAVLPHRPGLRLAGLALFFFDPLLRTSILELHTHLGITAALLAVALALVRLAGREEDGPTVLDYALVGAALGLFTATFPAAPVLVAVLGVLLLLSPGLRPRVLDRRTLTWALPVLVVTTAVLWPGGVFRIGVLKLVALRAYNLLFFGGQEWSSSGGHLLSVFARHPVVPAYVAALGAGGFLALRGKLSPPGQAVATAGATYALMILPFSILTRYLLPFVPLAIVTALLVGRALAPAGRRWLEAAPAALLAGLLLAGQGVERPGAALERARRADLAMVRQALEEGERILADGGHVYAFYLDDSRRMDELVFGPGARSLEIRENVENVPVSPDDYDRIVVTAWKEEFPVVRELRERCREVRTPVTIHFVCESESGAESADSSGQGAHVL